MKYIIKLAALSLLVFTSAIADTPTVNDEVGFSYYGGAGVASVGSLTAGTLYTASYGINTVVVSSPGHGYASAPTVVFTGGGGSAAAGTAVLDGQGTAANVASFREIRPATDSVISAITFPRSVTQGGQYGGAQQVLNYQSDGGIVGKTLTAGRTYQLFGTGVTFSSGTGIITLTKRALP